MKARCDSLQQSIEITKPQQALLFIDDLERIIGVSRLTLRRWWMAGKFPKPVKLHGTTLVWRASTVYDWIDQTIKH